MKILNLYLQNFKVFKDAEISFQSPSKGLCFMYGKNKHRKKMGANAVGKSSLWDALCWVFFGKTSRLLKATSVGNWDVGKNCAVHVLYLDRHSVKRLLVRTWSPNSLYFVGENGEQENTTQHFIEQTLGMGFEAFLNTVLIGQFRTAFFNLLPAVREQVFSRSLNLDMWVEASALASKAATEAGNQYRSFETKLSKAKGKLEALNRYTYSPDIRRWDTEQGELIRELEDTLKRSKISVEADSRALSKNKRKLEQLKVEEADLQELIHEREDELYALDGLRLQYEEALLKEKSTVQSLSARVEDIEQNVVDGVCAVCSQPVSGVHFYKTLQPTIDSYKARKKKLEKLIGKHAEVLTAISNERKKISGLSRELRELKDTMYRLDAKVAQSKRILSSIDREHREAEIRLKEARAKRNPFVAKQNEVEEDRSSAKKQVADLSVETYLARTRQEICKYWVSGFKEVRFNLIDEALKQFEMEVNSTINHFGMDGWKVTLTTDKMDKKGQVTGRGFQVYVQSPDSPKKVLWESWSGGESQRLSIAGTIALSTLIKNRLGVRPNIQVWDEPSTWLSEEGIVDLMGIFKDRSEEELLQLWVVDHSYLKFAGFDRSVMVVRRGDGSSVVEETNETQGE